MRARASRRTCLVLGLAIASTVLVAVSAADGQVPAAAPPAGTSRAAVRVDGHELFYVAGVSAIPASRRAETYADRIRALAANRRYVPGSLTLREAADRTDILSGETVIVGVFDADARLEGVERGPLARAIADRIEEAVRAYREERSRRYLRDNALYAVLATILLAAWLFATRRLFRRIAAAFERRYRWRLEKLRERSIEIVPVAEFWLSVQRAATTVWSFVVAASVLVYVEHVFSRLPWTRHAATWVLDLVLDPLRTMGYGIAAAIPDLVFLVILAAVVRYVLKTARIFFAGVSTGAMTLGGFDPDWALPTYALIRNGIVAFAVVVAFPYVPGSDSEAFKGVSIFVGVLVSIGSSSVVANTLAGYTLIYRRVFKVGDRVQIGSVTGDVVATRLQVTHLRTVKNEQVIVPNSAIVNSEVVNFSAFARSRGLILHTTVGIGYETPWRQVEAMLLLAARRTAGLLADPAPFVLQKTLGDFCVVYELNGYCGDALAMNAVYTEMHRRILDVFNEYGVQIMTPAYEGDPAQSKIVPKDQWYAAPAEGDPTTLR